MLFFACRRLSLLASLASQGEQVYGDTKQPRTKLQTGRSLPKQVKLGSATDEKKAWASGVSGGDCGLKVRLWLELERGATPNVGWLVSLLYDARLSVM